MMSRDEVLARLTSLLVENKLYRISIGKHVSTAKYQQMKKSLVKDVKDVMQRTNDGKMPNCVTIVFDTFTLHLNIDAPMVAARDDRIEFQYSTYAVEIMHADN